jgi:hypothetical protein
MLQCARCIATHGAPGCVATHETETGEPSCTWHLDGELCPIEQKQQRAVRKKPPEETPPNANDVNSEKPASEQKSGVTTMKTPETDTNTAPKICAKPGCTIELGPKNRSGKCAAHFHWTAPGERTSSAGNGHAAASSSAHAANGSARKTNGNGHAASPANGSNGAAISGSGMKTSREVAAVLPELAADRVDQLLATLPAGDKERLARAWLSGTV